MSSDSVVHTVAVAIKKIQVEQSGFEWFQSGFNVELSENIEQQQVFNNSNKNKLQITTYHENIALTVVHIYHRDSKAARQRL